MLAVTHIAKAMKTAESDQSASIPNKGPKIPAIKLLSTILIEDIVARFELEMALCTSVRKLGIRIPINTAVSKEASIAPIGSNTKPLIK